MGLIVSFCDAKYSLKVTKLWICQSNNWVEIASKCFFEGRSLAISSENHDSIVRIAFNVQSINALAHPSPLAKSVLLVI